MRETPVPVQSLEVKACIPVICTENDVTLAIGASVPMTNDAPVGEVELEFEPEFVPLVQPVTKSAPTVTARSAVNRDFLWSLVCI